MKVDGEAVVTQHEHGTDVRVTLTIEANTGGYGKPEPLMGALDHSYDGLRKSLVGALDKIVP